ncbi:MAG: hypothetical protein JSS05_14715 [Proteobacteria bacterium]|nr:hypothetical protein [Pseudomonadota bacterium]
MVKIDHLGQRLAKEIGGARGIGHRQASRQLDSNAVIVEGLRFTWNRQKPSVHAVWRGLAGRTRDAGLLDSTSLHRGYACSVEPYGIMYRKDDPGFARLMDNVIGGLFASGEIRAIHAKWFESGAFRLPMSQYMKENIKLPNKYGVP